MKLDSLHKALKRQLETAEEKQQRLKQDSQRHSARCQSETAVEKQQRMKQNLQCQSVRRQSEAAEEKQHRLVAGVWVQVGECVEGKCPVHSYPEAFITPGDGELNDEGIHLTPWILPPQCHRHIGHVQSIGLPNNGLRSLW